MDAFESVADNDGFEEVEGPAEIVEPASASAPKEATPAPKEATPEPEPEIKEASDSGKTILGRSEKQRRVDAARAEQLRKLKERYNVEFANIQKKRPKPKAYNAASVLSAPDPEAKIKQILARDRAIYNEKQTRKGVKGNVKGTAKANAVNKGNVKGNATANGPRVNTRKRNAPSILSSTRSAATQIKEKARADLKALKESAENELREIGANVSVLHPIFNKAEHKAAPKSRSRTRVRSLPARLNQMTRNNN